MLKSRGAAASAGAHCGTSAKAFKA
jgi:hypothetical protein